MDIMGVCFVTNQPTNQPTAKLILGFRFEGEFKLLPSCSPSISRYELALLRAPFAVENIFSIGSACSICSICSGIFFQYLQQLQCLHCAVFAVENIFSNCSSCSETFVCWENICYICFSATYLYSILAFLKHFNIATRIKIERQFINSFNLYTYLLI